MLRFATDRDEPFLRLTSGGRERPSRTRLELEQLEAREVPATGMMCDGSQAFAATDAGTKTATPTQAALDTSILDFVFANFRTEELAGNGGPAPAGA